MSAWYFPLEPQPPKKWGATEATLCDCGSYKAKTTHANWCSWKEAQDEDEKVRKLLKQALDLEMKTKG